MMEYGLQLYSVRDITEKDLPGAIRSVSKLGYKGMEFAGFFGFSAEQVLDVMKECGVSAWGTHTGPAALEKDRIAETVRYHHAIGCDRLIMPGADLTTREKLEAFAKLVRSAGAYLAEELARPGNLSVSEGNEINVIHPETNANNHMLFRDNMQDMVWGKNVLLLISSASTGKTIIRAVDCLQYYNGNLVGVAALFSAAEEVAGQRVESIFKADDLPGYENYLSGQCAMCKEKKKVDAIVDSFGYSKI